MKITIQFCFWSVTGWLSRYIVEKLPAKVKPWGKESYFISFLKRVIQIFYLINCPLEFASQDETEKRLYDRRWNFKYTHEAFRKLIEQIGIAVSNNKGREYMFESCYFY